MDKINFQTKNLADEKYRKLADLFPTAVTESIDDTTGEVVRAIDKDILMQEISTKVVEGKDERYQFSWPDKRKAILAANAPISATLRPVVGDSVGKDGTPGKFDSENLYIEGDNLDVLKLLQETYLGKVKMIYIDPPYNTGNDFIYNDNFAETTTEFIARNGQYDNQGNRLGINLESNGRFHTDWLNMMFPRLKLAKNLLTEDGTIFISINDNEVEQLKQVCNEIFGNANFVSCFIWQQRKGGGNDSRFVATDHEYVLVYAKNITAITERWYVSQGEDYLKRYREVDENGQRYYWDTLVRNGLQNPIVITLEAPDGTSITINSQKSKETVKRGLEDGTVRFTKTNNGWSLHHRVYMKGGQVPRSILTEQGNNRSAGLELVDLFGKLYFDYAKPTTLLQYFCQFASDDDSIILDFFSGSATTAQAIIRLNAEDNSQRRFIMVQLPEKTDKGSEAQKAGFDNICSIGKERIYRASKKIREEMGASLPAGFDGGFRCFRLDSSNMQDVELTPEDMTQDLLSFTEDNIKIDRTSEDLLFHVMLRLGIDLGSKIEKKYFDDRVVYSVADGFLLACFDTHVANDTVTAIAKEKPFYAVFRDSCMVDDSTATNFDQIFETYSKSTIRKVL